MLGNINQTMPQPANIHKETTFEKDIVDLLIHTGEYHQGHAVDVERESGYAPTLIVSFIKSSQPKEWERFTTIHQDQSENKFLYRLNKEIESSILRLPWDLWQRSGFCESYRCRYEIAQS